MLVVVESPNKIKSIQSYLGDGFEVVATSGHFRDLPRKHLGNLPEKWQMIRGKGGVVTSLKKATKRNPDGIVLATDPDREGEGIAWHVCDVLGLDPAKVPRAIFHEITRDAVCEGVRCALLPDGPRLNQPLVGAQKARRLIDRRIGYSGTRHLWKTVGGGVSAGRCLIPAAVLLRDINRREDLAGKRVVIKGEIQTSHGLFRLHKTIDSSNDIPTSNHSLLQYLPGVDLDDDYAVVGDIRVVTKQISPMRREPPQPLDTASAIGATGLSPSATMRLLQSLFEKGFITYHRTTSREVSDTFKTILGKLHRTHATQSEGDGAHEAIRPTTTGTHIRNPDELPEEVTDAERRTYGIVWKHATGSLYPAWRGERMRVTLQGGWNKTYERTICEDDNWMSVIGCAPEKSFPSNTTTLTEGDVITISGGWIRATEESAGKGVTESGMVRVLKESGIGRPSTYSTIVANLTKRGLAGFIPKQSTHIAELVFPNTQIMEHFSASTSTPARSTASFRITDAGEACIRELYTSEFSDFFQVEYTSKMEETLDAIANHTSVSDWGSFVEEIDGMVRTAESKYLNETKSDKRGAFPETKLGHIDGWDYGKGRTRYGTVVWRHEPKQARREYKKISAKKWHMITKEDAVGLF